MTVGVFGEILSRLQDARGLPPELLEFYREVLIVQSKAEQDITPTQPDIPPAVAAERRDKGLPLLTFGDLALDWSRVREVFAGVAAVFAGHRELFGEVPLSLQDPELLKQAVRAWYERDVMPSVVADQGIRQNTIEAIVHITLKPFLAGYSRACRGLIDQEQWRRNICPICGGTPDLAYLEKENGARHLVCSRCDMDWLFQRLQCPYCGNIDQNSLAYFADDAGVYRLYVCERCRQYLKAIDLRQAKADVNLPLERILTLSLDAQAQQQGYTPPGAVVSRK